MKKIIYTLLALVLLAPSIAFSSTVPFVEIYSTNRADVQGYSERDDFVSSLKEVIDGHDHIVLANITNVEYISSIGIYSQVKSSNLQNPAHFSIRCLNSQGVTQTPDVCDPDPGVIDNDGFLINPLTNNRYFQTDDTVTVPTDSASLTEAIAKNEVGMRSSRNSYNPGWQKNNRSYNTVTPAQFTDLALQDSIYARIDDDQILNHAYWNNHDSSKIIQVHWVDECQYTNNYTNTYCTGSNESMLIYDSNGMPHAKITYIEGSGTNIFAPTQFDPLADPDPFDLNSYDAQACSTTENFVSDAICNAMVGLFYPSASSLQSISDLRGSLSDKFPFVFMFQLKDSIENLFTNTGTATPIAFDFGGFGQLTLFNQQMITSIPFVGLLKGTISTAIWIMFAFGITRRVTRIFNQNNV